jgi:hypothetical protein
MTESPARTESLCPVCLRRIPARRVIEKEAVYLKKSCPEHGEIERTLIWTNSPKPYPKWSRPRGGSAPDTQEHPADASDGCPFDCGICPDHRQDTCTVILELTGACDLTCPVCFAASETSARGDPRREEIAGMLESLLDRGGPYPIQLSGGEPALRDDLPQIVATARKLGFDHVQVNTNGIRLARDADYAAALKDAGVTVFFLQFDGVSDDVYLRLRGAPIFDAKLKAVERCAKLQIGVILVPTLARDVNDRQVGGIIRFAKQWMPAVKGVHFQPMAYIGRYPQRPRNHDRILIPEILRRIEEQTAGELRAENFIPSG